MVVDPGPRNFSVYARLAILFIEEPSTKLLLELFGVVFNMCRHVDLEIKMKQQSCADSLCCVSPSLLMIV